MTFGEFLVVVAILLGLIVFLYPAWELTQNPKGPYGASIPHSPPDEKNRVMHETGLSIVAPENWDRVKFFEPEVPWLSIAARGTPGARLKSLIIVSQCAEPPDPNSLHTFAPVTFQTHSAFEKMEIVRRGSFDDPASSVYELFVDRNGEWWNISFSIADEMTELPLEIRQYIETVEFPNLSPAD